MWILEIMGMTEQTVANAGSREEMVSVTISCLSCNGFADPARFGLDNILY